MARDDPDGATAAAGRRWADQVARLEPGSPFAEQWARFTELSAACAPRPLPVWQPGRAETARSNAASLIRDLRLDGFAALHAWSAGARPAFWQEAIRRLGIVLARAPRATLDLERGPLDPRWLPGAELNCVHSCFGAPESATAVVAGREGAAGLQRTSYGELRRLVERVAGGLRRRGYRPGDGVALYMPMTLECVAAYLGTIRAGCVAISIPDSFPAPELRRRLELGRALAIVTVERFTRSGRVIEPYATARQAGAPPAFVVPAAGARGELRPGDRAWDDLAGAPPLAGSAVSGPEATINVLFSSGTTGEPKAIPWTQLTPIKCAADGRFHQDIRTGDVVAWPTNIGWMMGPWLIWASLINRATLALFEGSPGGPEFARFVERAGVRVLGVIPSLVRAWRAGASLAGADWSGIRVFSSTGEPSSREDYLWLMSRAGYRAPVIEYCGGTEIGGGYLTGSVLQPASPASFTTPALGLDIALLDEAGAAVSGPGEGEVFVVPPSIGLSQRLLNRDHEAEYHAGCPRGPAGQPLRRHGDRMVRLDGGAYRALGRADDAMNLGGIKVGALEIERVVDSDPRVAESAAVGVRPGGEGAEQLVLYVVPVGRVSPAELQRELAARIARELNPLFKIHEVELLDALPRTASNKLMRRELRERRGRPR